MEAFTSTRKVSVYDQRKLTSIPAPLEADSDSDFNEREVIVPEPMRGRKRRDAGKKGTAAPRRVRGERGGEGVGSSSPKRQRRDARAHAASQNPLLEYFNELGLHSASEDEGEADPVHGEYGKSRGEEEEEEKEEEEDADEEGEQDSEPVALRTMIGSTEAPPTQTQTTETRIDSDTESESDDLTPVVPPQPKRRSTPAPQDSHSTKRAKITAAGDSLTESDSDVGVPVLVATKNGETRSQAPSGSSTESDPELDAEYASLRPRPALPLPPGVSRHIGPLVLDAVVGVMVPGGINTFLREYQRDGVRFFWERWKEGRGGLLGDDMGLGKTIQVISFLSAIMRKHGDKRDEDRRRKHVSSLQDGQDWRRNRILPKANAKWPTCLIVCPAPVVGNWQRELETWGYFEVGLYTESKKERKEVLKDFAWGRLDILITSPAVARMDIDLISDLPFSCIFIDEVHNVKNPLSKTSKAFNTFDCSIRFGLTGTAIQNDYMELWTILDWTNPGRVGNKKQWRGYVANPLKLGQSKGASEEVRAKAIEVATILKEKLLPRFFLRRTKDIIKDQLPKKIDQVVFCPLAATQIAVYKRILAVPVVQNIIHGSEPCDCGSKNRRKACCHEIRPGEVLKYIAVLLKLSNHLALILPSSTDTPEQTERNRVLSSLAFPEGHIPKFGQAIMIPQFCGKWLVLETLLQKWREDRKNKVLIFTKSVKLLSMLEYHLAAKGYSYLKLEGATPRLDRMRIIDKFHEDPDVFVFLISTTVGGTGLNLQGANRVVIFDPNWNPAHDLQAMDRAYRFGQTRDVHVYRLLGAGSLEELIYARQVYKQQQMAIGYQASVQTRYFAGVQGDAQNQGELFGVKNIFKLHEDTLATKQAIETAAVAELDWALANISVGKSSKKAMDPGAELAFETDARGAKEDGDLRGLGTLLFDDDPPPVPEEDEISKALNAIGVKYSHQNTAILQPSRVEEVRSKDVLKRRKAQAKKARASKGATTSPVEVWPPKRSRTSPMERLTNRQTALIELGMITGPAHMSTFAQEFTRKPPEEQNEILAVLDKYAREHI